MAESKEQCGTGKMSNLLLPPRPPGRDEQQTAVQRQQKDRAELTRKYTAVIGIDFGTACSGIAYSLTADPESQIRAAAPSEELFGSNIKTPTSLLITVDNKTVFGKDADEQFAEEAGDFEGDESQCPSELYKYFKMELSDDADGLGKQVAATNGKRRLLIDVVTRCLATLKDFSLDLIGKEVGIALKPQCARWVITLPAIWTERAKMFMREAAQRAGIIADISSRNLLLALEPECAALSVHDDFKYLLKPATKYLVLDCGGGTIDITAHEVQTASPLRLKELHPPTGGPWGGKYADDAFVDFVHTLIGAEASAALRKECGVELELRQSFEDKKRALNPGDPTVLRMNLSNLFSTVAARLPLRAHPGLPKKSMAAKVEQYNSQRQGGAQLSARGCTLKMSVPFVTEVMFQPLLDQICGCVDGLLKKPALDGLAFIVIVGGFGCSKVLQHAIRSRFETNALKVCVPKRPRDAVVAGAVRFGLDPRIVAERKSKFTYGIGTTVPFEEGTHDETKRYDAGGEHCATDVYHSFVKRDEPVNIDDTITHTFYPLYRGQRKMDIKIYKTFSKDPTYVTDGDSYEVKSMTIVIPPTHAELELGPGTVLLHVLDTSGSMAGERIAQAVRNIEKMSRKALGDDDIVAVQGFADRLYTIQPPVKMCHMDWEAFRQNVKTAGGTALYDAVVDGPSIISRLQGKKFVNLLTDGANNRGANTLATAKMAIAEPAFRVERFFVTGVTGSQTAVLNELARAANNVAIFGDVDPDKLDIVRERICGMIAASHDDHVLKHKGVEVSMRFGFTEIMAEARTISTGEQAQVSFGFDSK